MTALFQAEVALFSPPYSTLTYLVPSYLPLDCWQPRLRVAVPLGNGVRSGVIISITPHSNKETTQFAIKPMLWPLEKSPLMQGWYQEMAQQMALRHTTVIGHILANILPAGMRTTQLHLRFWGAGMPQNFKLPALLKMPEATLADLGAMWANNNGDFTNGNDSPKSKELCELLADPPWPVRPVAKAQIALLEYLLERRTVPRKTLLATFGQTAAPVLAKLIDRGLVGIRPANPSSCADSSCPDSFQPEVMATEPSRSLPPFFQLTKSQGEVFSSLSKALHTNAAETHLLFGVTGSGKTALYLELARQTLEKGQSVLLLAPEVALALKLWNEAKIAYPSVRRFLFHGYLPASEKETTFRAMATSSLPTLVIGTRSALFLPVENIGLIVLDEEHDTSFKQDEGFSYQAKEIAWYRAGKNNALLLLGSATPDVKSYYATQEGHIPIHTLTTRVGMGELPEVHILAMPNTKSTDSLLGQESLEALKNTVANGEQAIILLNRRGYAPLMFCLECNTVAKCPHCDISLAYHKGRERLICHYCGYTVPYPSPCSSCKSMHFLPMGEGTEKLEESLSSILPYGTKVLRLDRDSTRRPGQMEQTLTAFARKEASVLVGTQMLSKGHHFPDVTLAIVADADLGLNLPDYRAAERTFQLLVQSAGRSGRGEKKGQVIIQTRDPSHYCWAFVQQADYKGFFQQEIELRKRRNYPPFTRLALIRISHAMNIPEASEEVTALGVIIRAKGKELGLTVLGPTPAPIPFAKGRRRYNCLVKGDDWQKLRALYLLAFQRNKKKRLRIALDLDPVNML